MTFHLPTLKSQGHPHKKKLRKKDGILNFDEGGWEPMGDPWQIIKQWTHENYPSQRILLPHQAMMSSNLAIVLSEFP
jgi:hypothetical protein